MRRAATPVLLGLALCCLAIRADTLPPVDESSSDPEFAAFRKRLLDIVQKRDLPGLLAQLDPKMRASFGDAEGLAGFRRYWKLDRAPAKSGIWQELATVLRLGATREDAEFVAPYTFTRFPKHLDAFTNAAVIRESAKLRKLPSPTAAVVETLSFELVELLSPQKSGWFQVRTASGREGWLVAGDVRSPLDYRAFFEKKNGRWLLTAFVKGD